MKIREILEHIRNTAGSNDKRAILEANKSKLLEQIFTDTYDNSRNYYVKKYNKDYSGSPDTDLLAGFIDTPKLTIDNDYCVFHDMLDTLNSRKVTGNAAVNYVEDVISSFIDEDQPVLHAIMERNLKIGIAGESFNKSAANEINKFEVALAYNLDKVKNVNPIDGTYFASRKLDGVRCIAIVDTSAQTVDFYSRQGKKFTSLSNHVQPMLTLCDEYTGKVVFDGELCAVDENGNEDFAGAVKQVSKKDVTAENIKYCIFDVFSYDSFIEGEDTDIDFTFSERYRIYTEMFYKHSHLVSDKITILEQERITSQEQFDKWTNLVAENGWEGFMLRKDAPYKAGRTKELIKVKKFMDAEYVVEGIKNGTACYNEDGMKEYDIVAALIIRHKGNMVQVGSGLSKEQRIAWFKDPSQIIGKTITVQYFEETQDSKTKQYSLRFPVLKYVYEDGRNC